MECFLKNENNFLYSVELNDLAECKEMNGYTIVPLNDFSIDYYINPLDVAEAFSWGFGVITLFWFFGYCFSVAKASLIQSVK